MLNRLRSLFKRDTELSEYEKAISGLANDDRPRITEEPRKTVERLARNNTGISTVATQNGEVKLARYGIAVIVRNGVAYVGFIRDPKKPYMCSVVEVHEGAYNDLSTSLVAKLVT